MLFCLFLDVDVGSALLLGHDLMENIMPTIAHFSSLVFIFFNLRFLEITLCFFIISKSLKVNLFRYFLLLIK